MRHRSTSPWARLATKGLGAALLAAVALAFAPAPAAAQGEVVEYYATDAVGSTRVVFAPNGDVKAQSDYLPFGEALNATGNLPPQRFTGQERDGEAGLDNFNARGLDVNTGRFLRLDPASGDPKRPQTWNRYAYVYNNPLSFNDPSGVTGVRPGYNVPSWVTDRQVFGGGAYGSSQYASRPDGPPSGSVGWSAIGPGYQGGELDAAMAAHGAALDVQWLARALQGQKPAVPTVTTSESFELPLAVRDGKPLPDSPRRRLGPDGFTGEEDAIVDASADFMLFMPGSLGGAAAATVRTPIVGAIRNVPANLAEKLAMDEAIAGAGRRIMQGAIKDPARPENVWMKMQHVHDILVPAPGGPTNIVIHYWEHVYTGVREGFKFK